MFYYYNTTIQRCDTCCNIMQISKTNTTATLYVQYIKNTFRNIYFRVRYFLILFLHSHKVERVNIYIYISVWGQ
jgi:hypothetical protein